MKNQDRYKTAQERSEAFIKYCDKNHGVKGCSGCPLADNRICSMYWLELEAEEEKPLPCPFCGGKSFIHEASRKKHFAFCRCGYTSSVHKTESEAIAAHNRVAKAVKESEAK